MPFLVLKSREGSITLTPEEIKALGPQIAEQLKGMSFTEMLKTAQAVKAMLAESGINEMINRWPF